MILSKMLFVYRASCKVSCSQFCLWLTTEILNNDANIDPAVVYINEHKKMPEASHNVVKLCDPVKLDVQHSFVVRFLTRNLAPDMFCSSETM